MKFARPINTKGKPPKISQAFIPGYHNGIDYVYTKGTPVYASQDGRVVLMNNTENRSWRTNTASDPYRRKDKNGKWIYRPLTNADYGQFVKLQHLEGYQTISSHLSRVIVNIGDEVKKGQKIGEVGTTGNSTGNHLHHELRKITWWNMRTKFLNLANYFHAGFNNYFEK